MTKVDIFSGFLGAGKTTLIKKLIAEEDKSSPLPDENIAEILYRELGVKISRRTVAKYRSVMDIPTSSRRKKPIL